MRISDWSSDVCSSDLLTQLYRSEWSAKNTTLLNGIRRQDQTAEHRIGHVWHFLGGTQQRQRAFRIILSGTAFPTCVYTGADTGGWVDLCCCQGQVTGCIKGA